jgi:hypothetical protein
VAIGRALNSLEALDNPRAASRRLDDAPPVARPAASRSVSDGPRWYRSRIRSWGPFVALIPPLLIGLGALAVIRVGDSTPTGIAGLVAGTWAAPVLLAVGAPLSDSSTYPVAVAGSVIFWLVVGLLCARRATRHPVADWGDYWRHFVWAAFGVLVGVCAALATVGLAFGKDLL